jgi:SAM-dependent methyltransferase
VTDDARPERRPRRPEDFHEYYAATPPWEIGGPQPALSALAGEFTGHVLDVGCGTGEHALLAASLGLAATGIDANEVAIGRARAKAAERGLDVRFELGDALALGELGEQYETIVDSALFHVFEDADRAAYVRSLASVLRPGGRYHMLCFSDRQPGEWGPRRVSEAEIRAAFADGWRIDKLERAAMIASGQPVESWLASISRV